MLAKATAPDKDGPKDGFPDFSAGVGSALGGNAWFWITLSIQLVIPFGFVKFIRKEQLSKPYSIGASYLSYYVKVPRILL
jgi:alpha-1,3-glucan synthase